MLQISDAVLIALISALAAYVFGPVIAARLPRLKPKSEVRVDEGNAAKSLAEAISASADAMKVVADEYIRRLADKDADVMREKQVVNDLLDQLKKSDERLAKALEDKQQSLAFQTIIEQQASALSQRVSDLEVLTKGLLAEKDALKVELAERDRVRDEQQVEVRRLEAIVHRHSTHIVELQDQNTELKKFLEERDTQIEQLNRRIGDLEAENRMLRERLGMPAREEVMVEGEHDTTPNGPVDRPARPALGESVVGA